MGSRSREAMKQLQRERSLDCWRWGLTWALLEWWETCDIRDLGTVGAIEFYRNRDSGIPSVFA